MKKKLLSIMVFALLLVTLVGCGKDSDTISDSTQENEEEMESEEIENEEIENEEDSETTEEGFMDTSMDGGAPASEVKPDETTSEEPTTEEVVPVEATFTLMSEDGSAVAFEGTVPEGLTLVSGDGTNHIEFAYDENPAVTVYLDGRVDIDVLAANEIAINDSATYYNGPLVLEKYPIDGSAIAESDVAYAYQMNDSYLAYCDFTINGERLLKYGMYIPHIIQPVDDNGDRQVDFYAVFSCGCHDGYAPNDAYGYEVDPNSDEFGDNIYKITVLNEALENPITFTVRVEQPEIGSVSDEEMEDFLWEFGLGSGQDFACDIVESFAN